MAIMSVENMNFDRFLVFSLLFGAVLCDGTYNIISSPEYIQYLTVNKPLSLSELPSLIQTTYGFSSQQDLDWSGVASTSPFKRPRAQVLISVHEASQSTQLSQALAQTAQYQYRLKNDLGESEVSTESVGAHILQTYSAQSLVVDFSVENAVFEMQSRHPHLFGHLPSTMQDVKAVLGAGKSAPISTQHLNVSVRTDASFLAQAYLATGVLEAILAKPDLARDSFPDFYHLQVAGYRHLLESYPEHAPQVQEANTILLRLAQKASEVVKEVYGEDAVVQVVTYSTHGEQPLAARSVRSLKQEPAPKSIEEQINKSEGFSDTYHVTFNIILWLMVALALTVLFVSCGIWNMDPGTDSIIYRMTSQRIKRD